jgi:hypothetical protein
MIRGSKGHYILMSLSWIYNFVSSLLGPSFRRLWKWILRKFTGRGEIERVLRNTLDGDARTRTIARSLQQSRDRTIVEVRQTIFGVVPFDVARVAADLIRAKRFRDPVRGWEGGWV